MTAVANPTVRLNCVCAFAIAISICTIAVGQEETPSKKRTNKQQAAFFESKIRPILVQHCYQCHSEEAGEQQGGLLLDRESGWLSGGDTDKAVIPFESGASLLIKAVHYQDDDLQMPPDGRLDDDSIRLLESWIEKGAAGGSEDMGDTEFSRLGDQDYLFQQAKSHWAFQPVDPVQPPKNDARFWDRSPIDRFIYTKLDDAGLRPSRRASLHDLCRRLHFDLTGLPPKYDEVQAFVAAATIDRTGAIESKLSHLISSPAFGVRVGRMWLDVARYADTDGAYRPDTKSPHYYPFAFSYRDYVIDAFNTDKPFNQFLKEQFAADLVGFDDSDSEIAALGFLGIAPHANRAQAETLDDWIDVTTRGLMGMTVACARCHDHKYEPIPTVDYYSLRGVFASITRPHPLDEDKQPTLASYVPTTTDRADYEAKLAKIQKQIKGNAGKKAKNNNRPVSVKIRDTELAELWLYHPGAPARAMVVRDKKNRPASFVHIRGDAASRGESAPPRFLRILDSKQPVFDAPGSGRLDLINKIVDPRNPLTARVFVNRIWGLVMGSHLVGTPSDFGLQGERPSHPQLLDWLTADFVQHGWSTKHLVRQIVRSETYAQTSRAEANPVDLENRLLGRANCKHLSIEAIRDSVLCVTSGLDASLGGHPEPLWGDDYTHKRTVYGFINRFNLDPTLRAFDFPTPMQSQAKRGESIVATQSLFMLNSPFVIKQCHDLVQSQAFQTLTDDSDRTTFLFQRIFQRAPVENERKRVQTLVRFQTKLKSKVKTAGRFNYDPWPMVAQSLMMSNEFQYVD